MSKTITRGAVAAGDPRSVAAGLNALRNGGNAVDALLAAGLTAAVVETFLTGLGGGGVALVRSADDGVVRAHDFFATVPGLGRGDRPVPATTPVEVDYGVEVQVFHGGPASVAVPGIPAGFADLHRRYGRLPMEALVEPALHHARRGFEVDGSMTVVCELIAGVISLDPAIRAMFLPGGEVVARGTTLRLPELGDTLELFAREGARPFYEGEVAGAMLAFAGGDRGPLTAQDLRAYRARRREPRVRAYRDGELFLNPPPGAAGFGDPGGSRWGAPARGHGAAGWGDGENKTETEVVVAVAWVVPVAVRRATVPRVVVPRTTPVHPVVAENGASPGGTKSVSGAGGGRWRSALRQPPNMRPTIRSSSWA